MCIFLEMKWLSVTSHEITFDVYHHFDMHNFFWHSPAHFLTFPNTFFWVSPFYWYFPGWRAIFHTTKPIEMFIQQLNFLLFLTTYSFSWLHLHFKVETKHTICFWKIKKCERNKWYLIFLLAWYFSFDFEYCLALHSFCNDSFPVREKFVKKI